MAIPEAAAETCGKIRAELKRKGLMIGNNDLWISAHAKAAELTLVASNEREFRRVTKPEGPKLGLLARAPQRGEAGY